jgi:hypothetical protein
MPFKQARKALELAVPIFLPPLDHHGPRHIRHDDLFGTIGRSPQYANRVIMGQHHMADRFIGETADLFDGYFCQTRGRLCLDDHNARVADDHARVRVTLGGKDPKTVPDFIKSDFLFGHIPLGCECLSHCVHSSCWEFDCGEDRA